MLFIKNILSSNLPVFSSGLSTLKLKTIKTLSFSPFHCFYFLLLLFSWPGQENLDLPNRVASVSSIAVDITFGRGPSCTGRGLCQVDEPGIVTVNANVVRGELSLHSSGSLQLSIDKNAISAGEQSTQFKAGQFKIIDAYALPVALSNQMGFSQSLSLAPGDYPVEENTTHFTIAF